MMRLKHLLGVLVPLLLSVVMAAATGSQLTGVSVSSSGNASTVTLRATGTFSHNEYRPEDRVLLVDLAGVTSASLQEKERSLDSPAVKSYRVLNYKGASGVEVTRVELALAESVSVNVAETREGLQVQLKSAAPGAAIAAKPAETKVAATETKTVPASEGSAAAIRHISVQNARDGMSIEIDGATTAKAIKLSGPDRIVLDFDNTVSEVRTKNILVNSPEVKSIRVARFQLQPPVTRIVVDLKVARDYQLASSNGKLVLKLQAPSAAAPVETAVNSPAPKAEPVLVAAANRDAVPLPKEPKVEVAPVRKEAATVFPSTVASAPKPADKTEKAATATEFAFVEPSFSPKKETVPATAPVEHASSAVTVAKNMPDSSGLPSPAALAQPGPAQNLAMVQAQQAVAAANRPQKVKYSGEPISVNLKDVDLKDFFRLVHEISGLNVVLDPNVHGTVTLVLDDVPWDQALDIVLKNNSLDRQLEGNVLRIAALETLKKEADMRRAQVEAQALAVDKQTVTRFLSYARAKDISVNVKRFLSPRGDVTFDDRTNSLIISDIPNSIPDIDRLLAQLDRKTQEVEIEARVVAANRTFARDIGFQLGFAWGNATSSVGGPPGIASMLSPITWNGLTPRYLTDTTGKQIPLFSNNAATTVNSGLGFTNATNNYRIDAILTMAESQGLVKILSRPRIVTQNNVSATVRQGTHVPVVTQAQLGGPSTTTYVDAFLRLTVTPQITVENTIFLAVDVENTTPDFGQTVGGNPALLTQQATTQVLVTDGGTVVIGGVIQTQNSVDKSQTPLLGDIPILGNLFKRRSVKTDTRELIFFLSPRIIQT